MEACVQKWKDDLCVVRIDNSSPSMSSFKKTVALILSTCIRVEQLTPHLCFSRCPGVSSRTRRVVNLDFQQLFTGLINNPA
jgi:hypothetical protein